MATKISKELAIIALTLTTVCIVFGLLPPVISNLIAAFALGWGVANIWVKIIEKVWKND